MGCSSLTSIEIPEGVTSIGNYAFYQCTALTSVTSLNSTPPTCGSNVFSSSTYTSATLYAASTDYLTADYWEDFENTVIIGTCGENLTWTYSGNSLTISGSGAMYNYTSAEAVPWNSVASSITTVTLPDELTTIGDYAFYRCSAIMSISIPSSVTSIGEYAFYGCSTLTSIEIPEAVTTIGDYAFSGCTAITTVTSLNETPPTIAENTFSSTTYASATLNPASLDYSTADYWSQFENSALSTGKCGENLTYTFTGATGTLVIEGSGAMYSTYTTASALPWYSYRDQISSVSLPEKMTTLSAYAFYKFTNLTSIVLPDSLQSIGSYALSNCSTLQSITLNDALASIDNFAFYNSALTNIAIPANLSTMGQSVFSACTNLSSVTFAEDSQLSNIPSFPNFHPL